MEGQLIRSIAALGHAKEDAVMQVCGWRVQGPQRARGEDNAMELGKYLARSRVQCSPQKVPVPELLKRCLLSRQARVSLERLIKARLKANFCAIMQHSHLPER